MSNIKTMTHMEMEALLKKGFSFDALHGHPSLIYRRTMLKRRQQLIQMMALLQGNPSYGTVTGRISSNQPALQQLPMRP